jgi:hypothetical protein
LGSVAGEWAEFDEEWLFAEARKRAKRRDLVLRTIVRLRIGNWLMTFATERHWLKLVELLGKET